MSRTAAKNQTKLDFGDEPRQEEMELGEVDGETAGTKKGPKGQSRQEQIEAEIQRVLGPGEPVILESVDFSDPNRPKTCLEVDFPILPINQIAQIEQNAGKPIYQMSKWWARRRSSVFRSTLLAAATKAPDDPLEAASTIWKAYYKNHQNNPAFRKLRVADIFMGGGTTLVEGSRLGMRMLGNDLNPVAWFVVRNEFAQVTREEVQSLLADIEAEVRPQVDPMYACDGPHGEKGRWFRIADGEEMPADFTPLQVPREERKAYRYAGPRIVYVFWAKHGPCSRLGCGHRTHLFSSPVIAVKEFSVPYWTHKCSQCKKAYHVERKTARMAPDVPLVVAEGEAPFATLTPGSDVTCPHCHHTSHWHSEAKAQKKKVALTLLIHPDWLKGESGVDSEGNPYGGSAGDDPEATAAWYRARATRLRLVEVRGTLPEKVTCPETGAVLDTVKGPAEESGKFTCGSCGTQQRTVESLAQSGKMAPVAPFVLQGYSTTMDGPESSYSGRFFAPVKSSTVVELVDLEWKNHSTGILQEYWPKEEIPFGHMTHQRQPLPDHGYTHWWKMFNSRQLLVHALLMKTIGEVGGGAHRWEVREFVLGAFQQYLRNQNMFCFWNLQGDKLEPHLSNNNFHPKNSAIENNVYSDLGRGNWTSCIESLQETLAWSAYPWESGSSDELGEQSPNLKKHLNGKGVKIPTGDSLLPPESITCGSSTDLAHIANGFIDLVITDPPFGGLLHYSELSDFFHVWLRLALGEKYPEQFGTPVVPKKLEAVSNKARNPEDPDGFYRRILENCWREAARILKPSGLLAFTFHHKEDAPWVDVLESLFYGGFYLEAIYPIRSDEVKGDGEFGSKKIEFDMLHVCRKRTEAPTPISWAKLRRQLQSDVNDLQRLLESHRKEGLSEADLQVIRRGKALEYYSRHYDQVYVAEGENLPVKDALLGIHQLLESEATSGEATPPQDCDPLTRQFLLLFGPTGIRSQTDMQKFLRGTGIGPEEYKSRGWCQSKSREFIWVEFRDFAKGWKGKSRKKMGGDYEQAAFVIGVCMDESGFDAARTLDKNPFDPHPQLAELVGWISRHFFHAGAREGAVRALKYVNRWKETVTQSDLFRD